MQMKLQDIISLLLLATTRLLFVVADDKQNDEPPFLRGAEVTSHETIQRSLLGNNLEKLTANYDPNDGDPICWLKYKVKGDKNDEVEVSFTSSQITETDKNVTCRKSKKDPKEGLELPLKEDIDNFATWVGEKILDADVRWGLNEWSDKDKKRLDVVLKKVVSNAGTKTTWEAYYDPKDPKCWLKYKVGNNDKVKVSFKDSEIKETPHNVTCKKSKEDPKNGLKLPVEKDIDKDATWVNEDVFDADVRWGLEKWGDDGKKRLELSIKLSSASAPPKTKWEAWYNRRRNYPQKCWLKYQVGDKEEEIIRFKNDEVFDTGDKVECRKSKVEAKNGLKLPVDEDIDKDATWHGEEVKDADVRWKTNGSLELAIKRVPRTCEERVEYEIRKASLNPDDLDKSSSSQRKALDWLKGVVDCDELRSTYSSWIQPYVLATLWYNTDGGDWKSDKLWLGKRSRVCWEGEGKEGDWEHIYCYDTEAYAEEINLDDNRLSGKLPVELGLMNRLLRMNFTDNELEGGIPKEFGNIERLEHLWLSDNKLEGTIPKELGELEELSSLRLNGNKLGGSMPKEICDLKMKKENVVVDSSVSCPSSCCTKKS